MPVEKLVSEDEWYLFFAFAQKRILELNFEFLA
jgi:hypothetical protein